MRRIEEAALDASPPPAPLISLTGDFDGSAARELIRRLAQLPSGFGVRLDFSHLRSVEDRALAAFASTLGESPSHVALGGLSQHHTRLLRYFGVYAEQPSGPLGLSDVGLG